MGKKAENWEKPELRKKKPKKWGKNPKINGENF